MPLPTKVFFPLKTNTGWFQSPDLKEQLVKQFKQAVLLYDEIIIEDGTYQAVVGQRGSFDVLIPPNGIPVEQRTIGFKDLSDEKPVFLAIIPDQDKNKTTTITLGTCRRRVTVDYYELIKDIDLESADFIKLVTVNEHLFSPELKTQMQDESRRDEEKMKGQITESFLRGLLCKNMNRDLAVSIYLGAPLFVDYEHKSLLLSKSSFFNKEVCFTDIPEEAVLRNLVSLNIPSFDGLTIARVVELRHDRHWR